MNGPRPLAAAIVFLLATAAPAATIHVAPNGSGDGSASNPTNLQQALIFASGNGEMDTLRLRSGTYSTNGAPFRYDSALDSGVGGQVIVEGGWAADYASRGDDPAATVLDGRGQDRVLQILSDMPGVDARLSLLNLTVRSGSTSGLNGAGVVWLQSNGASVVGGATDCVFDGNQALGALGGAVYSNGQVAFSDTVFRANSASSGGALYLAAPGGNQSLGSSITGCRFEDNSNPGGSKGSSIFNNATLWIGQSSFEGRPGGGSVGLGSAVYNTTGATLQVAACTFTGIVTEDSGSAITFYESGGYVKDSLFAGNRAGNAVGNGTIFVDDPVGNGMTIKFVGCSFVGNRSQTPTAFGGAIYVRNHATVLKNSVLWDNGSRPLMNATAGFSPVVSYSLVQGGLTNSSWSDGGNNLLNVSTSPFLDYAGGDYRPGPASPLIDAGDTSDPDVGLKDLAGAARVADGDGDGTPDVDIGAYEVGPTILVTPPSAAFGTVEVGEVSPPVTFTVENRGLANLDVGTITITGFGTPPFRLVDDHASGETVAPGGTTTFGVEFEPLGEGEHNASLSIPSNDPGVPHVFRPISGTGEGSGEEPTLPIQPPQGTIGTILLLGADDFGFGKPKVWVEWTDTKKGKAKKKKLKVLTHIVTEIKAAVKAKLARGVYRVKVKPKGKGASEIDVGDFEIMPPVAGALNATTGSPGAEIAATGTWFGDRKAKPIVTFEYVDPKRGKAKRKRCRAVRNGLEFDPATGESTLTFLVPKVPPVTGKLILENRVGEVVLDEDFTVGE